MDRPNTPSRPPDYALPSYDEDHDRGSAAAVRLLTSVEEPLQESRQYEYVSPDDLLPQPLEVKKRAHFADVASSQSVQHGEGADV